jgi:hypothetical protein
VKIDKIEGIEYVISNLWENSQEVLCVHHEKHDELRISTLDGTKID